MVTSKKPVAAKPADQFISLIKAPDQKDLSAQKTVTKGPGERKTEKKSEEKVSASTARSKGTKVIKPPKSASKPSDNKKGPTRVTTGAERAGKKTTEKPESTPTDRPTSAWPFSYSESDS